MLKLIFSVILWHPSLDGLLEKAVQKQWCTQKFEVSFFFFKLEAEKMNVLKSVVPVFH